MDNDGPPEPTVERVEKPDGRYILYFTWPEEQAEREPSGTTQSAADE